MKRILYFYIIILATMMIGSCSGCGVKRTAEDAKRKATAETPDSTIVVSISQVENDTLSVKSLETGRIYKIAYSIADKNKNIYGRLTANDTIAVTFDHKKRELTKAINLSNLLGLWMIKGKDGEGFRFCEDGTIAPVNMPNIILREWKIYNGDLYITYNKGTISDDTRRDETVCINILDPNDLNIRIDGIDLICTKRGLITID